MSHLEIQEPAIKLLMTTSFRCNSSSGASIRKSDAIRNIIKAYEHDAQAEGELITKRRLWYILKPKFRAVDFGDRLRGGEPIQPISNADYNKYFNKLAENDEIDDTFISDNSRTKTIGERLPHIILVSEKATIKDTILHIANRLGCSCYIAGGFSSIYAAKDMMEEIATRTDEDIIAIIMSDHDKAGYNIQDTVKRHFNGCVIHRALLTPDQVPEDKLDEYFDVSEEHGRHYELDILKIDQLIEVFLSNIPEYIALEIEWAYKAQLTDSIKHEEVMSAVDADPELQKLRRLVMERENSLWDKFASTFNKADPITIHPFDLHDIHDNSVDYDVEDWR